MFLTLSKIIIIYFKTFIQIVILIGTIIALDNHLWNSVIFIWTIDFITKHYKYVDRLKWIYYGKWLIKMYIIIQIY